ncbi:MAG: heparinase II/III-family protein [Thermoflavifilum sp.]|nr:heparinase II/III-family protein [Thermoflavifilum sp.]
MLKIKDVNRLQYIPLFIFFLFSCSSPPLFAQHSTDFISLEKTYSFQALSKSLLPVSQWHPYPSIADTSGLYKIPASIQQAYIHAAQAMLPVRWEPLLATAFLEYSQTGNRSHYEQLSFHRREQLATLVLAELFERKGRFIHDIINGIWAICEESFWGVPAHMYLQGNPHELPDVQHPVVDLFAAETAQEIAWTYYLLKPELDRMSTWIARRMQYETTRRIFIPYLLHDDWSYLGFHWRSHPESSQRVNNWNPWINSNVLAAALVLAPDSLRARVVYKTLQSLDNFLMPYPTDGGSDEGPEYWDRATGATLDYLEMLKSATGGKVDIFNRPLLYRMASYIEKVYIADPYFFNYGDADAQYHPDPALLFRFGLQLRDSILMGFGAFEARQQHFGDCVLPYRFGVLNRALSALSVLHDLQHIPPMQPLYRDVWLPDLQIMVARSDSGSLQSFYLAVQAGNNGKSHNHNDVGNFIVYHQGYPVLIDAGAQTYTAQTFSSHRYQIWNNQSSYHNLPEINGTMQQSGKRFAAFDVKYKANTLQASLSMDITRAYPDSAGVLTLKRKITLIRNKGIVGCDSFQLRYWRLPIIENFLTPLFPIIQDDETVRLVDTTRRRAYLLQINTQSFSPTIDTVYIRDGDEIKLPNGNVTRNGRMFRIWGDHIYRIRFVQHDSQTQGAILFRIQQIPFTP